MKKCVIYCRVSTDQQSNESSIEDLKNYCSKNDLEVCEVFKDNISGYVKDLSKSKQRKLRIKQEESDWEKLKIYIRENNIKQVICYELSRLGRTTIRTLTWIEELKKEGVNIYFKKENLNTLSNDPTTELNIGILSSIANYEGYTIKARTKRGMKESARAGKRVGYGKLPLGYTVDENKFIIVKEEEAEIVREIFKSVASGLSASAVADKLNNRKVPTYNDKHGKVTVLRNGKNRTTDWNPKTIKNIIKSTRYKGYRIFGKKKDNEGKIVNEGEVLKVPRIVSDELWDEANFKIDEHIGYLTTGIKYDYLFKSKITCGQCGYTMKSLRKYGKKGNNKKYANILYYTCQSYLHTHSNCDCGRFRSEVFDEYLYRDLFESGRCLFLSMNKDQFEKTKEELDTKMDYLKQKLEELNDEKKKTKKLYVKGYVTELEMDKDMSSIVAESNKIIEEITHTELALRNLQVVNDVSIKELHKQYFKNDFKTRRDFVERYVQRVKAYKVKKIDFDLTKTHKIVIDWSDKETPAQTTKFVNAKKNEVIWYVEVWAYERIEPIKVLMTSATGTNYIEPNLKFEKDTRIISISQ